MITSQVVTDSDHFCIYYHPIVDRVVRWSFPQTPQEVSHTVSEKAANTPSLQELQYKVFKDLWTKGYYLTAGLKYGGDYLVYPGKTTKLFKIHEPNVIKILIAKYVVKWCVG